MSIYTRQGDRGETSLTMSKRMLKDDLRVEVCGNLDELNAFMGEAHTWAVYYSDEPMQKKIQIIQNELFDLGTHIANPKRNVLEIKQVQCLEQWIDQFIEQLPPLKSFILPGGNFLSASLHKARSVVRRTERRLVTLFHRYNDEYVHEDISLAYINRLSDLLFMMARAANTHEEVIYKLER